MPQITVNYNGTDILDAARSGAWVMPTAGKVMEGDVSISAELDSTEAPFVVFSAAEDFTLATGNSTKNWDGTLEWSADAVRWSAWNGATTLTSSYGKLYLRGTGNSVINGTTGNGPRFVLTGSGISCAGNIENLLDYAAVAAGDHPAMGNLCFCFLFQNCTALTGAPELGAVTLSPGCYANMFSGCTSLAEAPALPAAALAQQCYDYMFSGCTAITEAPALPAATLAGYCYRYMFRNCTSLTTAPRLPATALTAYCYGGMFYGCTALTEPPAMSPTALADHCCYQMFSGCAALASAPKLPATAANTYCYAEMFYNCTSLTDPPELPATTLAANCYSAMFRGCTALLRAPALPAVTLEASCYFHMFNRCTALTVPPPMAAGTLASNCCYCMFYGCTGLASLPALPAAALAEQCYAGMFYGCTGIKFSTTQTGDYQYPYQIPAEGTGTTATNAMADMFANTGGTFTGTPVINTTYYTDHAPVVAMAGAAQILEGYTATVDGAAVAGTMRNVSGTEY